LPHINTPPKKPARENHSIPARASSWINPVLPWLGITAFFGLFFFYPLTRILWIGLNPISIHTISSDSILLASRVLSFTFYQAILSTLLTLLLGIPTAFLFARYDFRGKSFLRALTAIPFMLPTVVVAAGFNALMGPRGWINLGLMDLFHIQTAPIVFIGTLTAILVAHVFYNTTIVIRLVGNALSHLDPRLEQAARTLGANPIKVLWKVTLPMLRPSILAATILTFIFDFTSFGVILLLGGPHFSTLEVEIYTQVVQAFNLPLAGLLSLIQLFCTLAFSIIYSRFILRSKVTSTPHPPETNMYKTRNLRQKVFPVAWVSLLLVFFILPLMSLPLRSVVRLEADRTQLSSVHYGLTVDYYKELFINRQDSIFYIPPFAAIGNSLGFALLTVILSLGLGYPVATALARPGRLDRILDPLLLLPLGASAVTLGLGMIVSFNGSPFNLVTSPLIIPIAHTLIALPFVIRSLQPALASIPNRLRQAAASLGASPFRVWLTVDWPIVVRATLAAAVFAFTISLGEFGASSLVVRPENSTLPIAIARFLSLPGGLNYGQAMAMATILMVVCGAGILSIERLRLPGSGEF
jgi:thiamine transport system permease protein